MRRLALAVALLASGCSTTAVRLAPDSAWDAANVFARIQRGEEPAAIVYQDERLLVIMDHAPVAPGHVLILSKTARARDLIDAPAGDLALMMQLARRLAAAERDGLGASGSTVMIDNGSTQTVHSLHVHVIPAYGGKPIDWSARPSIQPIAGLEPIAARLRAALIVQH